MWTMFKVEVLVRPINTWMWIRPINTWMWIRSVNGFKRITPKIPTMTSRLCHVPFVERKTITFDNVSS